MINFELELSSQLNVKGSTYKNIPWNRSLDVLNELAAKGTISYEGKPLLVDLFSKVPFFYEVTRDSSGQLMLSGKIQLKEPLDLSQCRFMAPCNPPWFIFNQYLKVIGTDVSWLELQKLPRAINKKELDELLEESNFENAPQLKMAFQGAIQVDPNPLLQLTDRTGAFANLVMDYGQGKRITLPLELNSQGRNLAAEAYWEKDLLETGFMRKKMEGSHYYCPLDKVGKSLAFLLELGWKIYDVKGNQVILESNRTLELEPMQERIHLKGKIEFGDFEADLKNVLGSFNRRERFIDLGSGKTGLLTSNDLGTLAEEIEMVASQPTLKNHQVGLIESTAGWIIPPSLKELMEGVQSSENPAPQFRAELRPYQQKGLAWLHKLYQTGLHGVLADEMGLGKTIQLLALLSLLDPQARHLIVVPTSLLFNWEREIERFLPELAHYRHHGLNRQERLPGKGVVLTSYNTLRTDLGLFKEINWDCVILDEAQLVKNPDTQTAQALYNLKSRFRLVITGTIIENHARELWAHFHFLMPGLLGDRDTFEKNLSLTQVDSRYVRKIHKMIRPFILRRKKEEVAKDLPSLEEHITFVEMEEEQRQAYDNFLAATRQGLLKKVQLEGQSNQRMQIFEALLRLRQITCHPVLVSQILSTPANNSGKMDALWLDLETIREEGKKALIFSQFASMLHLIANKLKAEGIPYCILEGATDDREKPVKQFQEDPTIPFFLITLKAGGVGLNLTAADYVLLYDPWWHEAAEKQAIARAHRIGQTKPVIAKRYITIESVEEKMLSLKKAKSSLFENILDGDLTGESLTMDDLNYLLT